MKWIFRRPYLLVVAAFTLLLAIALIAFANDTGSQWDSSLMQQDGQPALTPVSAASSGALPPLEPTYAPLIAKPRDPDIPPCPSPTTRIPLYVAFPCLMGRTIRPG